MTKKVMHNVLFKKIKTINMTKKVMHNVLFKKIKNH